MLKMVFNDAEISTFDGKILGVTKSLAIMHNTGATVFGALVLVITWFGLINGYKWAFWTILIAGIMAHAMWFLSDASIGSKTTAVNALNIASLCRRNGRFELCIIYELRT
jgi:hypothetical protein